jgi:hypothetical protein
MWRRLSLALKVGTGAEERDTRVHDRLADPKVAFKPLLGARVLTKCIWLYTGTGFSFSSDFVVVRSMHHVSRWLEMEGCQGRDRWVDRVAWRLERRRDGWGGGNIREAS